MIFLESTGFSVLSFSARNAIKHEMLFSKTHKKTIKNIKISNRFFSFLYLFINLIKGNKQIITNNRKCNQYKNG